ncbi:hypothetical protein GCM10009799_05580 [Nocardiopsis rhodophaea]|uniref:Uncharacterized protein n=1 Tax=Nocardiopsis rhodophaea TaxID=280238 RepID=A0ABN2SB33_9ACTN
MRLAGAGLLAVVLVFAGAALAAFDLSGAPEGSKGDDAPRDASISELQGNDDDSAPLEPSVDPSPVSVGSTTKEEGEDETEEDEDDTEEESPESESGTGPEASERDAVTSGPQHPKDPQSDGAAEDPAQSSNPETALDPAPDTTSDSGSDSEPEPEPEPTKDDSGGNDDSCTAWWLFC